MKARAAKDPSKQLADPSFTQGQYISTTLDYGVFCLGGLLRTSAAKDSSRQLADPSFTDAAHFKKILTAI